MDEFLWGVATSAYQSEGGFNGAGQPQTNWAAAERRNDVVPVGLAADFWNRYLIGKPEDLVSRFLDSGTDPRSLIVRVLVSARRAAGAAAQHPPDADRAAGSRSSRRAHRTASRTAARAQGRVQNGLSQPTGLSSAAVLE